MLIFKQKVKAVSKIAFGTFLMTAIAISMMYLGIVISTFCVELVYQGHYLIATESMISLCAVCYAYYWLSEWTLGFLAKHNF